MSDDPVRATPSPELGDAAISLALSGAEFPRLLCALLVELTDADAAAVLRVLPGADGAEVLATRGGGAYALSGPVPIELPPLAEALATPGSIAQCPSTAGPRLTRRALDCVTGCVALGSDEGTWLLGLVSGPNGAAQRSALELAADLARSLATHACAAPAAQARQMLRPAGHQAAPHFTGEADGAAFRAHFAALLDRYEAEREQLVRGLHDSVTQSLSALKFGLELARRLLEMRDLAAAPPLLQRLIGQLQGLIDEVRRLSFNARPPLLDEAGAVSAVQWLCREWADGHPDTRLDLAIHASDEMVPKRLRLVVFRTIEEALDNIARHAQATRACVSLARRATALEVEVMDEGVGFVVPPDTSSYLGLSRLRERVNFSGGTARVVSHPGRGTLVRAIWSLTPVTAREGQVYASP